MLTILVAVTAWAGLTTGLFVLALGDWKNFALKYAGVVLSTAAGLYMLAISHFYQGMWTCSSIGKHCDQKAIYFLMRNTALIIFHVTSGRDVVRRGRRDRRRDATGQKNQTSGEKR